jgi:glycosyltransferase involved in cell wall biosynthesis
MRILQVSMLGNIGGAAKVAWDLRKSFEERSHRSMLAAGYIASNESNQDVFQIPNDSFRSYWPRVLYTIPNYMRKNQIKGSRIARSTLMSFAQPKRAFNIWKGFEDFDYPASHKLLTLAPVQPDIVNFHNLHSEYYDLRALTALSKQRPIILTLHDMWLFTGHCAHAIDCMRWQTGCGQCPDLQRYPSVNQDVTDKNWEIKKTIYSNSRIYVVGVSNWIKQIAQKSMMDPVDITVIPNGVNLKVFCQSNVSKAREELSLPSDAFIILFVSAYSEQNVYKDFTTVRKAVQIIASNVQEQNIIFVSLGGNEDKIQIENGFRTYYYRYRNEPEKVALFYQAANLFLHAANADTFPSTILEALACGTPVIATAVGGIPEQVVDGTTGFLVPRGDADKMAYYCLELIRDNSLYKLFSYNAVIHAKQQFDFERQVSEYLRFYEKVIEDHRKWLSENDN